MTLKQRSVLPIAVICALSVLGGGAQAADGKGRFALKGAATATCERYLQAVKEGGKALASFGGWLEGYMTAVNQYSAETYDVVSFESSQSLAIALANHCNKHPEKRYFHANRDMLAALFKNRIKEASPLHKAAPADGAAGIYVYEETIKRLQTRLTELKLYGGPIDGLYNDGTRAAVRQFQTKQGLEPNAVPTQKTLQNLFRGDSASK